MLNEVKPNLDLLMSIRLGLAKQYGIPLDVPFRDYKAWYRWTGMEVPTQTMQADFVNQLYSKEGKPCRFEDIFEFERLSKAWDFVDGELKEYEVGEARISGKGLLIEPESTNYLLHNLNPMHEYWRKSSVSVEPNGKGFDVIEYTNSNIDSLYQTFLYDNSRYDEICRTLYTLPNPLVKDATMLLRNRLDGATSGSGIRYSPLSHYVSSLDNAISAEVFNLETIQGVFVLSHSKGFDTGFYCRGADRDLGIMMTYYGAQVEGGSVPTSLIETTDSPTTRLRDSLSTTIPQGHTITGDWDDTLHLFERDGQLDFEGYGYIRTLEIEVKV